MQRRSFESLASAALLLGSGAVAQVETSSSGGLGIFLSEAYSALSDLNSDNSAEAASATGSQSSPSTNTAATTTNLSSNGASATGSATFGPTSSAASASPTSAPSGNPLTTSSMATSSVHRSVSSSLAKGISSSDASSSAAASSSTAAAAASSSSSGHNNHTLPIVLGTVLGALALILLLLGLWCCRKRKSRARSARTALSPEDEEVNSWRNETGTSYTQISAGSSTPASHRYPETPPDMSQHPALRSENPFVPAPPPPRRTAPNARIGLTDAAVPGQEPFVKPTRPQSILRKPVGSSPPPRPPQYEPLTTGYGEAQSPTERGFDHAQTPYSPMDYQPYNPNNGHTYHDSAYSSQGDSAPEPLPKQYNSERPPTPFDVMGGALAGGAGARATAGYNNHGGRHSTSSSDRRSYESAPYDPASRHANTPPKVPSQSPKRARFSDSLNGGNGSSSESRTDSGESTYRLSSQMPGGWDSPRYASPARRGSPRTSFQGAGAVPPPQSRRLRLSDLQAQEQQWYEQHHQQQYGVGQAM